MTNKPPTWSKGTVVYQIYPRSFYDAHGTGVGNLQGIIDKLDYLGGTPDSLGVTAIWLSPFYTSPMADFGYDVANYTDVDPLFGNLADFEKLVAAAHERSIRVIVDFVPNHSSDEHAWFVESKSSRDNPKRDWYTWRDARPDGSPPNNWLSLFGGSAWELSGETGQYYLHSFDKKQPDLNWDNPEVREAMKSAMRFWLELGVDGFRVDAVDWLSKDAQLRDDPINPDTPDARPGYDHYSLLHTYSRDGPYLFDRLNEMTDVLNEFDDRFMIVEAHPETDNKIAGYLQYYQGVNPHLSAPFNFEGIYLPWDAQTFRTFVDAFQASMQPGYTPIYTVGNHDESRIASRIGTEAARTAAMMLLTLPGMAFVYYGEELGMTDTFVPADQVHDPSAKSGHGRDPERTPMQWDDTTYAGFSTTKPWLLVNPNHTHVNVASELQDPTSSLQLYKQLIRLREQLPTLRTGDYQAITIDEAIFSYVRTSHDEQLIVLLNFSDKRKAITVPKLTGNVVLSTYLDHTDMPVTEQLQLRPHEGLLIRSSNS